MGGGGGLILLSVCELLRIENNDEVAVSLREGEVGLVTLCWSSK